MPTINIYLHFDGNCEEAFNFYKTTFGVEFFSMIKYKDIPQQEGMPVILECDLNKVENVAIQINEGVFLMGSDGLDILGMKPIIGNNFSIYVEADEKEKAYTLFNSFSEGGQIKMPMSKAHWGDYFGMCTDKFGVSWFINYALKK